MQIPQRKWAETEMKTLIDRASGEIALLLKDISETEWRRMGPHAGSIMYRYWHLERSGITSAHQGEIIAKKENWPIGGMFYPALSLANHKVEVCLDYLSLGEWLRLSKVEVEAGEHNEESVMQCKAMVEQALVTWYERDPVANKNFKPEEWRTFWYAMWQRWGAREGMSTDTLLDEFVARVRANWPQYGMTSQELKGYEGKRGKFSDKEVKKWQAQYFFWMSFSMHLAYPLTCYGGLLSPLFIDEQMWREDVLQLAAKKYTDPMPIFGPCTNIALTEWAEWVTLAMREKEDGQIWV